MNTIELKADLLCLGMSADDSTFKLFEEQNPNEVWKTGNNGCFVEFDGTQLMVSIVHQINKASPYHYAMSDGSLIRDNEVIKENVAAKIYPEWYKVRLSTGRAFTEVFLLEGERFFHQAYKGCDYMAAGLGCGFCSTGCRDSRESTSLEIGEAAGIIKEHISNAQICLGGGTYLPITSNVAYFMDCVKEIRKSDSDIPIWIEMVPPTTDDVLRLIDAGATSFGFNIEIWDDDKRREMCPGKSEYSLNHYLEVLEFTAKLLPNKVGSCLLVGLDKPVSIETGIDALVDIGVHPCILPFKPFDGAKLEKAKPANHTELIDLSDYAVGRIHKSGMDLMQNQGCLLCECCSVMHDIWLENNLEV